MNEPQHVTSHMPQPPADVVTLGETMGLVSPTAAGPLQRGATMTLSFGGSESNVAIGLARLGVEVAWVGRLGTDALGNLIGREMAAEGVRLVLPRDAEAPNGLMLKERRASVLTNVWYYRNASAGSRLSAGDVPQDLIRTAKVLHVSGITPALSPTATDAIECAIAAAREAGVLVSFDVNFRRRLWEHHRASEQLRTYLKCADLVFAGLEEAELFVPGVSDSVALASRLCEFGPRQAVIKMGAAGCVAVVDDHPYRQEALKVEVIDSVGAGDAFVAGYLAAQLSGADVPRRLETGARLGAFACTTNGDWEGLPSREDLALLDRDESVSR